MIEEHGRCDRPQRFSSRRALDSFVNYLQALRNYLAHAQDITWGLKNRCGIHGDRGGNM
jgi:hypothetical protein